MKQLSLMFVAMIAAQTLFAQSYGTSLRKQYEKEKNGPHGECRADWTTLQPGLQYRLIRCLGDEDDLDLHVVRIDLDQWNVDAAMVGRATARTVARDKDAAFTINANFFDKSRTPLGAVVRSGDVVKSPRSSSWQSIFLIDEDGRPRIVMPTQWSSWRNRAEMAVQAGPRLVIAGHTNRSVKNNYAAARAGVCILKNGALVFFATPQDRKLHIKEIANVARRAEIDGGLACRDAMLFDGGHSVNFYAAGDDKRISIEGDPVPVYVYAIPRRDGGEYQTK